VLGTVYDEDGGVPGALVIVTDGESYAFDFANSSGIYAVNNAPTGPVLVLALAELHETALHSIDLDPQVPRELNIPLEKKTGMSTLYGHAFLPDGMPLSGVYVSFTQPSGLVREDLTNIYGAFELNEIPAGVGLLYAHKGGFHDLFEERILDPGVNIQDLLMVPVELGAVLGTVLTPEGDPVADALVRITHLDGSGDQVQGYAYSNNEGLFGFNDLAPGPYVVQSFLPGLHPGAAAGTVFEGTVQEETLFMWPTSETGTLEGWAVDYDGDPVPHAFGYFTYIGFDHLVSGWAVADASGHFVIEGVPFGAYGVRVESAAFLPDWALSDILPTGGDDFLKILYPFQPHMAGVLSGTVTDSAGHPVPYAVVGCCALEDPEISYKTFTDGDGHYCFPLLPPLVFGAFGYHPDLGFGAGFDQIYTGEMTVLNLTLE
jgi:hypothetical protein